LAEVVARNKSVYQEATAGASEGLDQNLENGYTALGELDKFSQSTPQMDFETTAPVAVNSSPARAATKPTKSRNKALFSDSDDTLPDLDSMAGVFTGSSAEEEPGTASYSEPDRVRKSANRDQSLEGDFSPKELAEGIRTVLKKDKEE
jgi:hypothetical protein